MAIIPEPTTTEPTVITHKRGKEVTYHNVKGAAIFGTKHGHHAHVVKGDSVRIWGLDTNYAPTKEGYDEELGGVPYDQTFWIGDTVEYGSYNLSYLGPIVSITVKNIIVQTTGGKKRRLPIHAFSMYNRVDTVAQKRARNSDTMMRI